jgi:hypothetical protein
MTGAILGGIADIGLVGVIIYLISVHKKLIILATNGGTMASPEAEAIDWVRRQGRFFQCEPDTPDRPQMMPGPLISPNDQTHTTLPGGQYRDGSATGMDT